MHTLGGLIIGRVWWSYFPPECWKSQ